MPTSDELCSYINASFENMHVTASVAGDGQVVVLLPKGLGDISAMILALDEAYGASCDLEQTEDGAALRVWHESTAKPSKKPERCGQFTPIVVVAGSVFGVVLLLWM